MEEEKKKTTFLFVFSTYLPVFLLKFRLGELVQCGITFRFIGCLEAPFIWSTVGDFSHSICKKGRQHCHHERNHKNERIHNKLNIMRHDRHFYDFKVFEMENYIHVWLLPWCCNRLINSRLASLINTLHGKSIILYKRT